MKYIKEEILIKNGAFYTSTSHKKIRNNILAAIKSITWPSTSNVFTINPQRHGNGVVPIKKAFIAHLEKSGWKTEIKIDLEATVKYPFYIPMISRQIRHFELRIGGATNPVKPHADEWYCILPASVQ